MNCLRLSISRLTKPMSILVGRFTKPMSILAERFTEPMSISAERFTEPMSLSAVCLSRHLSVSVGLICSVGRVRLLSSERFNLISKDGYILYSTLLN